MNDQEVPMSSVWIDAAGYLASVLVASTFYMKTMLPLRRFAIASNMAFIVYGFLGQLYPVLILHLFLLPLNVIRHRQITKLLKDAREAEARGFSLEWLVPYMSRMSYKKGARIFAKGDPADRMLYVHSGKVRISEMDGLTQSKMFDRGDVLGEIGMFAPDRKRTATAVAETDAEIYSVDEDQIVQLYYQNPEFAYCLVRLITRRLIEAYTMSGGDDSGLTLAPSVKTTG
jgi:hypothetical protein